MGILKEMAKSNDILTMHGFHFELSSADGTLKHCYEKCISLSSLYDAFVAVKPDTGEACIYIEYECGGKITSYDFELTTSYEHDPYGFFEELDEEVTEFTKAYT